MYGFYTPILLLQAFCIYHAYRNNAEQRWYWLILLFPLIGCIIYLVQNFNNRATLDLLKENAKQAVVSNYKLEQLQKAFRFSDNFTNAINLADAYVEVSRYQDAIHLYTGCLQGFMADDLVLRMKLLNAHFLNGDFDKAIEYGRQLESEKHFKNSEERVVYGWSLFQAGKADEAEMIFSDMDKSFTNYYPRTEYCKFLIKREKLALAQEKLSQLLSEFDQMQGTERRFKRNTHREIKALYEANFSV